MPTENKSVIDENKIVIFGAGKIGRSFIGQLFGRSGYNIVFIDVDQNLISLLNKRGSYRVIIKGDTEEEIVVSNVSAIPAQEKEAVSEAVATSAIAAVSVGKNALEKVIPMIAKGIEERYMNDPSMPLDIILAENMRSAADFTREQLCSWLPPSFPLDKYVGLIETSIGKMVPIMPLAEALKDPLMVFAEPYNTLILDRKGFRSAIPDVKGLAPKNNIKAWVDRKAFIHNLGHASAAYYGFFNHPAAVYMYEILDDRKILDFTREVMLQSAAILMKIYPDDYTESDLVDHIDDLLKRFRNKALRDTIFRVGQDLPRKLGSDDRFMGAIHLAESCNMPCDKIVGAMAYGFFFRAGDEKGNLFSPDDNFHSELEKDFSSTLTDILHLDKITDKLTMEKLKELYCSIKAEKK